MEAPRNLLNRRLQVFLGVVLGRWLHSPLSTTLRPSIAYFSHTFQGALDFLDSSFIILTSDPFSHFSSDFCESQNLVSSLSSELLKIFSKSRWKNAITSRENESGRFLGTARAFFRLVFCWSDRFVYELFVEISVLPIFLQIYVLRSEMTPLFAVAFFFRSFWWNRFLQIASFSSENILCSTQNETSFFSWQKFTFFVILSEPAAIRDFLLGLLGNQRDLVKLISFPILHRCFQVFARLDSNRVLIFVIFCTANVFFLLKHEIHRFFFSKELFLSRICDSIWFVALLLLKNARLFLWRITWFSVNEKITNFSMHLPRWYLVFLHDCDYHSLVCSSFSLYFPPISIIDCWRCILALILCYPFLGKLWLRVPSHIWFRVK